MELTISDFVVHKLATPGDHIFLIGTTDFGDGPEKVQVFFLNRLEEKKVFANAELTLSGELIHSDHTIQLLNCSVTNVRLLTEISLDTLSIKDRLNASGLIHEFREVYRNDKYRALEILKVLGVSEKFAEEMLIKNTFMLPFI